MSKQGILVIKRGVGDVLIIGDDVFIKISDITGKQVKLAFKCPKDVKISRADTVAFDSLLAENAPVAPDAFSAEG